MGWPDWYGATSATSSPRSTTSSRSAANQLSALRDAHAVLATLDRLLEAHPDEADDRARAVRDQQAEASAAATAAIEDGDERIRTARSQLVEARHHAADWTVPERLRSLGRRPGGNVRVGPPRPPPSGAFADQPTVPRVAQGREYLWYQTRLLRDAGPSVLGPLIDQLDDLAEALGDDHDLAVLVDLLDTEPVRFGSSEGVAA